ncbi:MAG: hypothetical protein WCR54_02020 [Clostridia bacterium]
MEDDFDCGNYGGFDLDNDGIVDFVEQDTDDDDIFYSKNRENSLEDDSDFGDDSDF